VKTSARRALKLFKLKTKKWHVNVSLFPDPSKSCRLRGARSAGEKVMGMSLDHGGHLTHGHKVSVTGKILGTGSLWSKLKKQKF